MIRRQLIRYNFTKISKSEVAESNYQQLIDKIVQQYGFKQFQTPSTVSLLQAHHLYKIFKPGDWVLDIGAGPYWSWTDLALKLTANQENSNLVISNDRIDCVTQKLNNLSIRGDFMQQPVRSNIAMNLLEKPVDTILIDAVDEFTGNPSIDASYTMQLFYETMKFSQHYLRKGGNIVLRTVQCPQSLENQEKSKYFFNQVYKHKPSNIPIASLSFFYVLKGFKMTSRLDEMNNFLKQYRKASTLKKAAVVERYKSKCDWDPVKILNNQAKIRIQELKNNGHKNSQIVRIYQKDQFVKAKQIAQLLDTINDESASVPAKIKASERFFYDRNITDPNLLPQSQKQFQQVLLQHVEKIAQQYEKKNSVNKKSSQQQKKPLKDGQVYMKQIKVADQDQGEKQYKQQDLLGYKPASATEQDDKFQLEQEQLKKMIQSFPSLENYYDSEDKQTQQRAFSTLKQGLKGKTRGQKFRQFASKSREKQDDDFEQQRQVLQFLSDDDKDGQNKQYKFDLNEDNGKQNMSTKYDQTDTHMKGDMYESQRDKKQYMQSKPKKADRYSNQRRSKRKNNNKIKF